MKTTLVDICTEGLSPTALESKVRCHLRIYTHHSSFIQEEYYRNPFPLISLYVLGNVRNSEDTKGNRGRTGNLTPGELRERLRSIPLCSLFFVWVRE